MAQQLTWQELRDSAIARVRESDSYSGIEDDTDIPYYELADIDLWLYEAVLVTLRLMDQKGGEETDTQIVQTLSFASTPAAFSKDVLKILGASVQTGSMLSPTGYVPATELQPVSFQQIQSNTTGYMAAYSTYNNQIWATNINGTFTGQAIRIVAVVQPSLDKLIDGTIIPPSGHDEEWVDYAHKRMLAQDLMPAGRM